MLSQFAPASSARQYDWTRKQVTYNLLETLQPVRTTVSIEKKKKPSDQVYSSPCLVNDFISEKPGP